MMNRPIHPIYRRTVQRFDRHLYRSASPFWNPRNGGVAIGQ